MLHRYESRQRNYTELCNRSSTRSLHLRHGSSLIPRSCDPSEDYWQDASVSLRSCHSWEATWLGSTTSAPEKIDEVDESMGFAGLISPQIRPCRYSFDGTEDTACLRGRRSFPPPLASCSTLSIKEGGRFVLKEMDADRPHGFFRAERGNGRLRLQLVLPDEVNDDEEDEHEVSSSPVEDLKESVEFGHVEHDAHIEETATSSGEECSTADKDDIRSSSSISKVGRCVNFDNGEELWGEAHAWEEKVFEIGRPTVLNVSADFMEINACSTSQDAGMGVRYAKLDKTLPHHVGMKNTMFEADAIAALDGFYADDPHRDLSNCGKEVGFSEPDGFRTDNFLTYGKLELNQFVAESNNSINNQGLVSLSAWSPKPICMHQSIVPVRPALGLAMS